MPRAGPLSLYLPLPSHRELLWLAVLICDVTASSAPKTTVVGSQTGLSALILFIIISPLFLFTFTWIIMYALALSLLTFACILSGPISMLHLLSYWAGHRTRVLVRCQHLFSLWVVRAPLSKSFPGLLVLGLIGRAFLFRCVLAVIVCSHRWIVFLIILCLASVSLLLGRCVSCPV